MSELPPLKAHSYIQSERRRYVRAQQGRAWSVKDLPQYYYHQNFQKMLDSITTHHGHLLGKDELAFRTRFRALPHAAQCAYVRLVGRKGNIFDTRKLTYSEIENLPAQFETLKDIGFIRTPKPSEFRDYLGLLTKPELTLLLSDHLCESLYKKSWAKPKLIEIALDHIDFEDICISPEVIVQGRAEVLHYLLFLYFGRIERSLQSATLNDLGLVKTAEMGLDRHKHADVKTAKAAFFYADALYRLKHEACEDFEDPDNWPDARTTKAQMNCDKLLQRLGKLAERRDDIDGALACYTRSDTPLCNERVVRLRYKLGETDWVKSRLEAMIDNPSCDSEANFAEDFYARKFHQKRTSIVTDMLRQAEALRLDEAYRNQPERAALAHYKAKGLEVYRTENQPWKTLFGLLFWSELYPKAPSFQLPDSLKTGKFYNRYRDQIEAKLTKLDQEPQLVFLQLLQALSAHYGAPNGVFMWKGRTLDRVKAMMMHAPLGALSSILRQMCQDYSAMKDGYPDLMVIEAGQARFIEIKAEGDVLRRNQLTRLQQLRMAGFRADIVRVDWVIDPDQTYVVVDVETTGGRAGLHRVTEIGAVKLEGGVIIDRWQSLINPQRSIPAHITRLTGISETMVADAPVFHEIADEFESFMGESIFAAHNVNFDYGFISAEYEMIDRRFRFPKICTCASMRKLYPGHRSYSLKNLCDAFQIDLSSHHRALCDAEAAAELLKLVNAKRVQ